MSALAGDIDPVQSGGGSAAPGSSGANSFGYFLKQYRQKQYELSG